jgi:hypothetical protein
MVKAATLSERHNAWTFLVATTAALIALAVLAGTAEAQGRGRKAGKIPPGHLPPPGLCRVWHDGVPPGHQPPATSCADARYEAARSGGRLIYGGGNARDDRYDRDRYPDARYPDARYPDARYPDARYPDDRYPDDRYPVQQYPMTLPEMIGAVIFGQGLPVRYVERWLGRDVARVTYRDVDRNGYPEAVTWYDQRGNLMQQWMDQDRDGRADRVAVYQAGRVVRVIR